MKIFKKPASKKNGQTVVEYALIAAIIGGTLGLALFELNPNLFRNYFKSSAGSTNATIDSNGQMTMERMGD